MLRLLTPHGLIRIASGAKQLEKQGTPIGGRRILLPRPGNTTPHTRFPFALHVALLHP